MDQPDNMMHGGNAGRALARGLQRSNRRQRRFLTVAILGVLVLPILAALIAAAL